MRAATIAAFSCILLMACSQTESPTAATPVTASSSASTSGEKPVAPTPVSSGVTVSGRVVDFQSHAGVAGVLVEWGQGDSWVTSPSTTTDATGAFSLVLATTGLFGVMIGALTPSFSSAAIYVNESPFTALVYVGHSECPLMYGRVFDTKTSLPVAGATVSWVDTSTVTEADGSYDLRLGCRSGGYGSGTTVFTVRHPQYEFQGYIAGRAEWVQQDELHRRDFALTPR